MPELMRRPALSVRQQIRLRRDLESHCRSQFPLASVKRNKLHRAQRFRRGNVALFRSERLLLALQENHIWENAITGDAPGARFHIGPLYPFVPSFGFLRTLFLQLQNRDKEFLPLAFGQCADLFKQFNRAHNDKLADFSTNDKQKQLHVAAVLLFVLPAKLLTANTCYRVADFPQLCINLTVTGMPSSPLKKAVFL